MSSGGIFDLDEKRLRIEELDSLCAKPAFWDDPKAAQTLLKEKKGLETLVGGYDEQVRGLADAQVFLQMAEEDGDVESANEAAAAIARVRAALEAMEFRRMLSGEMDPGGAVVQVQAGAGGVEACDWAQMLVRMILRYCERKGWTTELVDEQLGEEAGIKSVTFLVGGDYAYGHLRAENGVHRLVRISPFDANARRQTSFAAVSVSPDVDDDIEIEINEGDLRIDTYRAGGAGGQHVNKTDSAVRITHLPTGIVVQCQNERSQHKNKAQAFRLLRAKMYEFELAKQQAKSAEAAKERLKIEWGSQIRSYVLFPYQQVADHRTDIKLSNVNGVLDGELDALVRAYLLAASEGKA